MKISKLIDFLTEQLMENPDDEIMIYNSSGELIEPKGFRFGSMQTDDGWVDVVSLSDTE